MIALLRGRIAALGEDHLVLDTGGVGYLVHCGQRTLQRLPRTGDIAELWVETVVREDAILLYGFLEPSERSWFRLLQTVQGVGAKVALGLLGTLGPEALAAAIAARDRTALARAPGVGQRLATRLVAELAERLGELGGLARSGTAPAPASAATLALGPEEDALQALLKLGFQRSEAAAALARARARLGEGAGLEALVRESLKELAT